MGDDLMPAYLMQPWWPPLRAQTVDENGYVSGVAQTYSELKVIPRWSSPGSWTMSLPSNAPEMERLYEGCGLVIERHTGNGNYVEVMSGPLIDAVEVVDNEHPLGEVSLVGVDDLALLSDRLTYPDPTKPVTQQTTTAVWRDATEARVAHIVRNCVQAQVINGLFERQIPRLSLGSYPGGSPMVSIETRYEPLLQFCQRAVAPYGLGIAMTPDIQNPGGRAQVWRTFDVLQPVDRSTSVRFSYERGNLMGHEWRRAQPGYTRAIVGGAGSGTSRGMSEGALLAQEVMWARRIEAFVDRSDANTVEALATAVAEAITEGTLASAPALSVNVLETSDQLYGVHYRLGDIVSVEIRGRVVSDQVREVEFTHVPEEGFTVRPLIGPEGTLHPARSQMPRLLALVDQRLNRSLRT